MVEREILSEGSTFLFEPVPGVRSASLGVWLRLGSRHEPAGLGGICHFIEHLLFKGTETRDARAIALLTDRIGGNVDAFTSKEATCFYARVLDEHLPRAVDLLADIVRRPLFDAEELERERRVILEEIRMVQDAPEDRIYDLFCERFWAGHPLGLPVQGTEESVSGMSRDRVAEFFRGAYVPQNLVISAAGNLEDGARETIRSAFSGLPAGHATREASEPTFKPGIVTEARRELEQMHILLGTAALPQGHDDRFTLHLLNSILGGSLSSRLFHRIREERGLAYAVSSHVHAHVGGGLLTVYAATAPDNAREVIDITLEELRRLSAEEPEQEEVDVARDHIKGNILLALESTTSRMSRAAREEIVLGRHLSTEDVTRELERVTPQSIKELSQRLFQGRRAAVAAIGAAERLALREEELEL